MSHFKSSLLFLCFIMLSLQSQAQSSKKSCAPSCVAPFSNYTGILFNGAPLYDKVAEEDNVTVPDGIKGKFSVSTIDRSEHTMLPKQPVGFKVAIENVRSKTVWMYSQETLFEVDAASLLRSCDPGDKIIFMTVDRQYQLPRNQISTMPKEGC
jgi:hypothetical protein